MVVLTDPAPVPTAGAETLNGTTGNDTLAGYFGDDRLVGGAGDDLFLEGMHVWAASAGPFVAGLAYNMGTGDDTYWGGSGHDTLSVAGTQGRAVLDLTLGTLTRDGQTDHLSRIEGFELGDGGDLVTGARRGLSVMAGGGNDTVVGLAGRTSLDGGAGVDLLDLRAERTARTVYLDGRANTGQAVVVQFEAVLGVEVARNRIFGGAEDNVLAGGARGDRLVGAAGNDSLTGGDGNDRLSGGEGVNRLTGDVGDDMLIGGTDRDTLLGGEGNDQLQGRGGDDRLIGGAGANTLSGGGGNDSIVAGVGADGHDTVDAGAGDDTVTGADGTAVLAMGQGRDVVEGGEGLVIAHLGDGDDLARLRHGTAFGGTGADTLKGEGGATGHSAVHLLGQAGADVLIAGGTMQGTLRGGIGDDTLSVRVGTTVSVLLSGGAGDDLLQANGGFSGSATLAGGLGDDTYTTNGGKVGLTITDLAGRSVLRAVSNGESISFTSGDDQDRIILTEGGWGDSWITAALNGGADRMSTQDVSIHINGTIDGGAGNDKLANFGSGEMRGGTGDDLLSGQNEGSISMNGTIRGGDGNDTISYNGLIDIHGDDGDDVVTATQYFYGNPYSPGDLYGGAGQDTAILGTGHYAIFAATATPVATTSRDVVGFETILFSGDATEGEATWIDDFRGMDLDLGAGNDTISAATSGAAHHLGDGTDFGAALVGEVSLYGDAGNDYLEGFAGSVIDGGEGNDMLILYNGTRAYGGSGNDTVRSDYDATDATFADAGSGNDYLDLLWGSDLTILGGEGRDTARMAAIMAGTVDLGSGADIADVRDANGIAATLTLGTGSDTIMGGWRPWGGSSTGVVTVQDFDTSQDLLWLTGVDSLADIDQVVVDAMGVTLVEGDLTLVLLGVGSEALTDAVFVPLIWGSV